MSEESLSCRILVAACRQSVIMLLLVTVSLLSSLLVINQGALNVESRRSISSICIKYGMMNMWCLGVVSDRTDVCRMMMSSIADGNRNVPVPVSAWIPGWHGHAAGGGPLRDPTQLRLLCSGGERELGNCQHHDCDHRQCAQCLVVPWRNTHIYITNTHSQREHDCIPL